MTIGGNKSPQEPRVFTPSENTDSESTAELCFARDEWGHLVLTLPGQIGPAVVTPTPLFPISEPDKWISLRGEDGVELACVEDPNTLSSDARQLLHDELARREFVPVIERIVRVSG